MRHPNLFRLTLLLASLGLGGSRVSAQQNLFNVPSGNITGKGDLFFQQQFNFSRASGSSNTTVDLGLGSGWEVGANFLDVLLYERGPDRPQPGPVQANPDFLVNAQKGFEITDYWSTGVGGQFGFNPATSRRDVRFLNFSWAINSFQVPDREEYGKWYIGAYYGNGAYRGAGSSTGFMLGAEVPIIPEKLSFQFDWLGGTNDISVAVVGGVYTFQSGWQLSLGAQLPSPRSGNPYGVVLELTYPALHLSRR